MFGPSLCISGRPSGRNPTLTTTIFLISSGSAIPTPRCMRGQSSPCRERTFFPSSSFRRSWAKAWLLGVVQKHGIGMIKEDANQMPGIFYLQNRAIARAYRYRTIADQPDYLKLIA